MASPELNQARVIVSPARHIDPFMRDMGNPVARVNAALAILDLAR